MAHAMRPSDLGRLKQLEGSGAPFLYWQDGDGVWHFRSLAGDGSVALTLGRDDGVDLLFVDARVSSLHAELRKAGDHWIVQDTASTNGTFVNGDRITQHRLDDEDVVRVGETLLHFRAPGAGRRVPTTVRGHTVERKDLTDAQWRLLKALCRPYVLERSSDVPSSKQLAAELNVGEGTVDRTLRALNERFEVTAAQNNKRRHLIDAATRSGLVSIASYRA